MGEAVTGKGTVRKLESHVYEEHVDILEGAALQTARAKHYLGRLSIEMRKGSAEGDQQSSLPHLLHRMTLSLLHYSPLLRRQPKAETG